MLDIITRKAWGAVEPRSPQDLVTPVVNVFLAYSRSESCDGFLCREAILHEQFKHMNVKRMSDISYSYLIDSRGVIYEGRGIDAQPSLPMKFKYMERHSLYIVFIGSYIDKPPNDEAFQAREDLLDYFVKQESVVEGYRAYVI